MTNQGQQVPIIDKMMDILEFLESEPRGATLSQLCRRLDIPKSTAFRILKSLTEYRMLQLVEDGRRYVLGPRLVSLASVVKGVDLVNIGRPIMEAISERLSETCKLTVPDTDGVVVVAVTQSPTGFGIFTQVGRRFPYHAGAASKVCLAYKSEAFLADVISKGLMAYTESTTTNPTELRSELDKVRDEGWAIDNEEYVKGVIAIAAPIFDSTGQLVAALSTTFLAAKNERAREEIRQEVVKGARSVSQQLGASVRMLAAQGA